MDSYYPTIESTFAKSVVYKGVEYDCHIIDTAGQVGCYRCISVTLLTLRCLPIILSIVPATPPHSNLHVNISSNPTIMNVQRNKTG